MSEKIFQMLDLFYANKHLYEKIKRKELTKSNKNDIINLSNERGVKNIMIDWCNKFCCECYEIDIKCPYWNEKEKDTDCDNCEYFEEREENEND